MSFSAICTPIRPPRSARPASWATATSILSSAHASGPPPANNAELKASGSPSIQDVIRTSQVSIEQITTLMRKIETLVDTLNSKKGSAGAFINDPALYNKLTRIADDLQTITGTVAAGNGSLGKFITDDTLYTRRQLRRRPAGQDHCRSGPGQGKRRQLLKDDTLYNNLNSAVTNANQLVTEINAGKGSLGKIAKDPPSPRSSTTRLPAWTRSSKPWMRARARSANWFRTAPSTTTPTRPWTRPSNW